MATRAICRSCSQLTASTPSSAARAFLQVTSRRYLSSTPLDFLTPSIPNYTARCAWAGERISARAQTPARRAFTSSSARRQTTTTAIYNPRNDDDGEPMHIEITPRASNRLKEIMTKDANPHLALRIQVESGGCHGFQYLMSLTTLPPLSDLDSSSPKDEASPALNTSSSDPNAVPSRTSSTGSPSAEDKEHKGKGLDEDDTVFATEGGKGAKVIMDGPSLDLLKGSKIDYTMELIGSQFKIVDNPLATSSCGCGTSFDIKS